MRTPYKMKGSKFYGKGNQSPLKVGDEAVVASQKALNKTELDFRQPGWSKAARSVHEAVLMPFKKAQAEKNKSKSVEEITKGTELEPNEDLMKGDSKLKVGSMGTDGLSG
mgnify:FL=1